MFKDELTQDLKAFGGVPLFCIVIVVSFVLGFSTLAFQLTIGFALAYVISAPIRLIYFKQRPDKQGYKSILGKIDAGSFPSLHSMRAAILATILSLEFSNTILTLLFGITAIGVAVTRVIQKRHRTIDVVVGLLVGFGIALILNYFV